MTKARDLASAAPAPSTVSATEIGYLDGVSSAIQTQIDGKSGTSHNHNSDYIAKTLTTTTGDMIYASAADTPARLGIGSTGNILTVSGGVPAWAAPGGAGANWTLLNSGGTALTGATTITVSGISGKDKIMVILESASASAFSNFPIIQVRLNGDTGTNYKNYGSAMRFDNSYTPTAFTIASAQVSAGIPIGQMSNQGDGNSQVEGAVTITGCNSSGVKQYIATGIGTPSGWYEHRAFSLQGYYNSSSTISSVSVFSPNGNFDAGTVYVYASA